MPFGFLKAVDEAEKAENERASNSIKGPNNKRFCDSAAQCSAEVVTAVTCPPRLFTYPGYKSGNPARKYLKILAEEKGIENSANSKNNKGPSNERWSESFQPSVECVNSTGTLGRPKFKSWIDHNSKIVSKSGTGVIHSPTNHLERSDEQKTVIVELKAAQSTANPEIKESPAVSNRVQQAGKTTTLPGTNRTFYAYKMERQDKMPGNLKFTKNPRFDFDDSKPYTGRRSFLSLASQRSKKRHQTPVCLTISSDEEDESLNEKMNTSLPAGFRLLQSEECGQEKEASNSQMEQLGPGPCVSFTEDPDQQIIKQTAALKCRSVRIGTLKIYPPCQVVLTKDAFTINGESPNNIYARLPMTGVTKVLYNFGKMIQIVIVYTTVDCAKEIRRNLDMERTGHHYCPASLEETKRRVIFLLHCVSEVTQVAFKAVFRCVERDRAPSSDSILKEIDDKRANNLLVLSTPREVINEQDRCVNERKILRSRSNTEERKNEQIRPICVFPLETGGIPIAANDIACLEKGEFLNDIIIDFYLKYLFLNNLAESDRSRTHIFSSFFYNRLTTQPKMKYASNVEDPNLPAVERRHSRVKNWTRTVDIFQKDFLIIPMNENFHWFLAIICFPSMDEKDATRDDCHANAKNANVVQRPCIIVFDSLGGDCYRKNMTMLREYLTVEWRTRKNSEKEFNKNTMPGLYPKIPLQNNSSDCGIYLLQYVESFFMNPIKNYLYPIESLEDWFDVNDVNKKRDVIKEIILQLSIQQKGQNEYNCPKET